MTPEGTTALTFALIIPTHARPEFVEQAVRSGLRQERAFDRIIVVPDGVEDPASEALAEFPVDVHPIAHAGVAAARNAGMALADTDWVCFLDDDDLLHPSYLRDLEIAIAQHPDAGAFNAPYWSFGAEIGEREEFSASTLDECLDAIMTAAPRNDMSYLDITGHSFDTLLGGLAGSMSTAAVRTDILRNAGGFPVGLIAAEDWTMYVNVARFTEWRVLDDRRAFFRDHGGNAMRGRSTEKSLSTLRAIRAFWQPTAMPTPPHRPIEAYRRGYRYEVLAALAAAARNDDRAGRREALQIATEILPRRWDRVFVRMPRPVRSLMWRMEGGAS
ncbi:MULTISPECIES: glycosyltransferase family 2 protein [unclassified Microbacterium]|uniref:glycosyltransferase family 2 protein n=1 Tax=unclassified Microbacterium TaxID=2609290 RepID=UPI0012F79A3C|nr:glycosyltransferase family 2 protein [Microbacterium sp. MAH-37]MVQ42632.1 glycosyltransferase [Microbacterium sp. MAH-37]